MLDGKDFLKGFLGYLRDYYGLKGSALPASLQPNLPKLPLFQQADQPTEPQMPDMGMGGLLGATGMMDMETDLDMQGMGIPQQLNSLFPGPHDPMRLN